MPQLGSAISDERTHYGDTEAARCRVTRRIHGRVGHHGGRIHVKCAARVVRGDIGGSSVVRGNWKIPGGDDRHVTQVLDVQGDVVGAERKNGYLKI